MKIYAISDSLLTPYTTIESQLRAAINGGISIFQLRDKNARDEAIFEMCANLARICADFGVRFVINDRINLALNLQARGIPCDLHLGRDDLACDFATLRAEFRGEIGISCYDDLARARHFETLGADLVAFGSIFKSATKPDSRVIGTEILREARGAIKRAKICAIGGINAENISQIRADFAAMVGAIWKGNIVANLRMLQR